MNNLKKYEKMVLNLVWFFILIISIWLGLLGWLKFCEQYFNIYLLEVLLELKTEIFALLYYKVLYGLSGKDQKYIKKESDVIFK